MELLRKLFDNNEAWVQQRLEGDPDFFKKLSESQQPRYLWIGCSDSRVPANQVVGLEPGELFVHRNIANLFIHTDVNSLSVLEYAVKSLKVEHVIVCGHYGCGGVAAAMQDEQHGIVDNWLRNIRDVYAQNKEELDAIPDEKDRINRLSELSVRRQVYNICHTTIVQNAWSRGQPLGVHGWVYDLSNGRLKDLDCCIYSKEKIDKVYLVSP